MRAPKPKFSEYLPVLAFAVCIFTDYPIVGVAIMFASLIHSIIVKGHKIQVKTEGTIALIYLIITTFEFVYLLSSNRKLNDVLLDYLYIVLLPLLVYFTTSSIPTNSLNIVKAILALLLIFSVLSFFRNVEGNFTLSLSDNIYMHQRQVDDELSTTVKANKFFRNATLVSIWLVTLMVTALCLYNFTKKRVYLAVMFAALILIFLSNTRTALGCAMIIIFINLIIYKQGAIIRVILIAAPILYIIVLSVGNLYQSQIERFNQLFEKNSSYGLGNRMYYWSYTINLIEENIWGYGHNYVIEHLGYSTHNEYLGQLVSVGLLATICYFLFIIVSMVTRYRDLRDVKGASIWNELAFYLLFVYLFNGMTEQISTGNKFWMLLLFMCLGWSRVKFRKIRVGFRFDELPSENKTDGPQLAPGQ